MNDYAVRAVDSLVLNSQRTPKYDVRFSWSRILKLRRAASTPLQDQIAD
jgi:hypothetical protein